MPDPSESRLKKTVSPRFSSHGPDLPVAASVRPVWCGTTTSTTLTGSEPVRRSPKITPAPPTISNGSYGRASRQAMYAQIAATPASTTPATVQKSTAGAYR